MSTEEIKEYIGTQLKALTSIASPTILELMAFGISINLSTRMLLKKVIKQDGYKVLLQKLVFI